MGDFKRVKKKKKKVKNKKKKKRTNLRRSIVPWQTMGDVVAIVVEDDEKNAGEGRNRQVFEDIDNVFRRNHPKNDTAKINLPRTCSQHAPLVKLVVKRVVVPKPKKRAEKPKDVDVMEIISHSDEEHVLVAVHEIEKKSPAAKNKTAKEEIFDVDSTDAKDDLASVEYVEDIYSLYKSVESEWRSKDYMRSKPEINEKMRIILVKWLVDVCVRFELNPEPFYLTMNIMDQFFMTNETLDDYLGQECPEFLEEILELCDNQKILFDNKNKDKREKAEKFQKLMSLVDSVMFKNYGKPFTDKFFHELQEVAIKLHDQKREVERLKGYSKSEVLDKFKILAEQETRTVTKTLRTDRDGKLVSYEFQDYSNKHGIKRYLIALYVHKRNGVVERHNRTLAKMTKSILKHISTLNYLWRESARCATYLINKIASRSLVERSSYEELKGKKPNVEVLRIFGYIGYARTDYAGKESLWISVTFIIGLREFGSDGSQNPRVMRANMINQEELDKKEEENNDDEVDYGDEEQEWSQPQFRRSTRMSVRPAYLSDFVLMTKTECVHFLVIINKEQWIETCKEVSLYQKEEKDNLIIMAVYVDELFVTDKELPIVGANSSYNVATGDGKSMAGHSFLFGGCLVTWCLSKQEIVAISSCALGRFKFKEMRGVEDLSKLEFKLKGENVGLSLKEKGNLRNKLTSNPTELCFKGLGKYPIMLYLMSLGNLSYI
ncbi:unnamed protein product [Brassica rapa]|uniref:Integrase catalytic domain-containing protein n=2 Tax=Brassica TaxID=3705 RepID=A0A3P6CXX5_BRACM|nr:unnamed protein product [Brassica napus]CAG7885592.1 unnamed protein product [Brassica rapa]CDY33316.1 BnaAnng04270D [Brassica napus]VDD23677.1 unnamed protein product [Brassica rapa]